MIADISRLTLFVVSKLEFFSQLKRINLNIDLNQWYLKFISILLMINRKVRNRIKKKFDEAVKKLE
jgi:hypothetical protein